MPSRRPLREINGNRPINHELTPNQRAEIVGAAKCGVRITDIGRMLNFTPSTVRYTYELSEQRDTNVSISRAGRPSITSARVKGTVVGYARCYPKSTYRQMRADLEISLSDSTIKRILLPYHLRKWQCKKRPELGPEVVNLRYQWALLRKDWSVKDWALIIFSDESSVERGNGGQREWAWRTATQKWNPQFVQTYTKGHDISIMIWGAIWIGGRSDVVIMTRDEQAKRNGYSANSYIDVLNETIEQCWQPGMTFMQDNAPIHTAKKVTEWFKNRGIPVLDWAPYSPDLNHIEHVCAWMKQWINQQYLHLKDRGESQAAYDELARVIVEAWEAISQERIDSLIKSMDSRVNAVLQAKG
jgi:transposase